MKEAGFIIDARHMYKANCYYNKNLKEFARKLRKNSTKAEIKLWKEVLRAGKMHGHTFLRQRPKFYSRFCV